MSNIIVDGFDEIFTELDDMDISDYKKRNALKSAAEIGQEVASDASYRRTGKLSESWKVKATRVDGNIGYRVYSSSTWDIYNELGSPTNRKHIGFFTNAIDTNMDRIIAEIMKGVG